MLKLCYLTTVSSCHVSCQFFFDIINNNHWKIAPFALQTNYWQLQQRQQTVYSVVNKPANWQRPTIIRLKNCITWKRIKLFCYVENRKDERTIQTV